jgi:hypothetical protein
MIHGKYVLFERYIDIVRNVRYARKFASANTLRGFIALRRATSCNRNTVKADVTESRTRWRGVYPRP